MSDFRNAPCINISSSGCIRAARKRDPVLLDMMRTAADVLPRDAGVFVLPTRHEGFCVPIVEALAAGCKVIACDNSNTPAVTGGLASLVSLVNVD